MHLKSGLGVYVQPDATGGYFALVPALPGCGSQGDSEREVIENLDDAIMAVLDVLREDDHERLQNLCGSIAGNESEIGEADSTQGAGKLRRALLVSMLCLTSCAAWVPCPDRITGSGGYGGGTLNGSDLALAAGEIDSVDSNHTAWRVGGALSASIGTEPRHCPAWGGRPAAQRVILVAPRDE